MASNETRSSPDRRNSSESVNQQWQLSAKKKKRIRSSPGETMAKRAAIRRAKADAWRELVSSLDKNPWGRPYKIVTKQFRPWAPPITETLDAQFLEDVKCQGYGHTKNYCFKSPVCVKCAMNHLTLDCPTKGKIKEVKCANCDGNHPASYKGCLVRKQLQQKLYPTLREKSANQQTQNQLQSLNCFVKPNITYARAARTDHKQYTTNITQPQIETQTITNTPVTATSKIEQMMTQLMSRMDTMLNLLTSLINKIQ
ncbi:GAGJ protein, partial [Acromyrmex heyeri]